MGTIQEISYNDRGTKRNKYLWTVPKGMREVCKLKKGDDLSFNGARGDVIELKITRKEDILKRKVVKKQEELDKLKIDSQMFGYAMTQKNK